MPVHHEAEPAVTSRQVAVEVAAGITAGVAIMINIVRKLSMAARLILATISTKRA